MVLSKSFINSLIGKSLSYSGQRNLTPRCTKYIRVHHVIFDLDGIVLCNQDRLDNAYKAVFEKFGQKYDQEWRFRIMGMTSKDMWKLVQEELKLKDDWQKLYEYYKEVVKDSLPFAPVRPGLVRLVDYFEKHDVPMAVVTSSTKATMKIKTAHIPELIAKFSHVVSAGDDRTIKKSKPHGQIYAVCAGRFHGKPEPENCLVFEDTYNGVLAASCACMQVIGVPCVPVTDIAAVALANEPIDTLYDFWPGKYGLPPFPEQVGKSPPPPRF